MQESSAGIYTIILWLYSIHHRESENSFQMEVQENSTQIISFLSLVIKKGKGKGERIRKGKEKGKWKREVKGKKGKE